MITSLHEVCERFLSIRADSPALLAAENQVTVLTFGPFGADPCYLMHTWQAGVQVNAVTGSKRLNYCTR